MRSLIVWLVSRFAQMLVPLMQFVPDLAHAERIGVDRPMLFERILMRVFAHRNIEKLVDGVRMLYLRRFFLTPRKWRYRVFLHHIVRSDDDRHPHDHPFAFATTILNNGYRELIDISGWDPDGNPIPADIRLGRAGDVFDNPAEHVHRLELPKPMWTLVVVDRAEREWGFITAEGDVPWRKYLGAEALMEDQ